MATVGVWAVFKIGRLVSYESTWEWWIGAYLVVGAILGSLGALLIFGVAWMWCVEEGRFWGFAIGWAPSAILAFIGWWVLFVLWLPALVITGLVRDHF